MDGFALFSYSVNRPETAVTGSNSGSPSKAQGNVEEFLSKERKTNDDFSLSLLVTDLRADHEARMRDTLARRLSRGVVYSGSGTITRMPLPSEESVSGLESSEPKAGVFLYYCLLRPSLVSEADATAPLVPDATSAVDVSVCSVEFVVCFLFKAYGGTGIFDPFRLELDAYSSRLHDLLSKRARGPNSATPIKEDTSVMDLLRLWREVNVLFLSRCLSNFSLASLAALMHAALVGERPTVILDKSVERAATARQLGSGVVQRDIDYFIGACEISGVLQPTSDFASSTLPSSTSVSLSRPGSITGGEGTADCVRIEPAADATSAVAIGFPNSNASTTLTISVADDLSSLWHVHPTHTNTLCTRWAHALKQTWHESVDVGSNTQCVRVRRVLEQFKLEMIRLVNTLKRLVRQAEIDHYALYRAHAFLADCGAAHVLVNMISRDTLSLTPSERDVLAVLVETHPQTVRDSPSNSSSGNDD